MSRRQQCLVLFPSPIATRYLSDRVSLCGRLASSIRLKQLNPDLSVVVVEKGSELGAHVLSGNVFETRALDELSPDWKERGAPITTPVKEDA